MDDIKLPTSASGRYIKMNGRLGGYTAGYSLWDFEAYNGSPISYTYDANGNVKTITQGSSVISYNYDELNEVTREDNQVLNKSIAYAYDAGGNLLSKTEYPCTTGTLGTPTRTYNYSYDNPNWKDELTSYDGSSITYDAIGNPLTYNGWTYTWEEGRQLSGLSNSGTSITYKYNDDGIRTQKTVNGVTTKYHLVGDEVTSETNGTNTINYTYDTSENLVSMNLNGTEYYYIRDGVGNIIGLFDSTGTQVVSYTYDTWGRLISIIGSLADTVGIKNPYRYHGYRYDNETGLYYLQSRYYNPEWGRFINADVMAGSTGELLGHNVFAYCKNNPVNMSDKDGFGPQFDNEKLQRDYVKYQYEQRQQKLKDIKNKQISKNLSSISSKANVASNIITTIVGQLTETTAKAGKVLLNSQLCKAFDLVFIGANLLAYTTIALDPTLNNTPSKLISAMIVHTLFTAGGIIIAINVNVGIAALASAYAAPLLPAVPWVAGAINTGIGYGLGTLENVVLDKIRGN